MLRSVSRASRQFGGRVPSAQVFASAEGNTLRSVAPRRFAGVATSSVLAAARVLPVGGAFHSPLMSSARQELAEAIEETTFNESICPIYQNVTAAPTTDASVIKENLIAQLTGAVKWTQIVQQMHIDGATNFIECGPGKVLQGLVQKIVKEVTVSGHS